MDAVIMCGGEGTRLDARVEKPLLEVGGRAMVDHVLDAVAASRADTVVAAVSPQTPKTSAHLDGRCRLVETPGEGYVADLDRALGEVTMPALTLAADLPLLEAGVVDEVISAHRGSESLAVVVPRRLKERLGVSVSTDRRLVPTGCNVVGAGDAERTVQSDDVRLAVNVNTVEDARIAEKLLESGTEDGPAEGDHDKSVSVERYSTEGENDD